MFPAVNPKTAQMAGNVTWSTGAPFDGYLLLVLVPPLDNSLNAWPTLQIGSGKYPPQRVPLRTIIPIVQGTYDPSTRVFFNSSIDPPGTQYAPYWFDNNKKQIPDTGGPPGFGMFFVSTDPCTLTPSQLPYPTLGTTPPNP